MANFKCASINVTSFIKLDRRVEIDRLFTADQVDFGMIQETRLKSGMSWRTKSFKVFRNDAGVGTLIMARNRFKCKMIEILNLTTSDCTCIEVEGKNHIKFFVISIYIRCSSTLANIQSDLDLIAKFCGNNTVIMGGDLNTSNYQKKYVESWINLNANNFRLASATVPTFRSGNFLDHFIVSTDVVSRRKCLTKDIGLEHKLILLNVTLGFGVLRGDTVKVRKWFKTDWTKFQDVANLCLHTFVPEHQSVTNDEIDLIVSSLKEDINNAIDQGVPTGRQGFGDLWDFPKSVDHWFRERRRLRRILARAKGRWLADIDRIEHIKRAIGEATRKINKVISEEHSKIISSKIKNINENRNKFKVIRSFTHPISSNRKSLLLKTATGDIVNDEEDKAELLSQFYGELYEDRTPDCDQLLLVENDCNLVQSVGSLIKFGPEESALRPKTRPEKFLKFSEVGNYIKALPNKISAGDDNIPNIVLRKLPISYIVTLTKLFNHCINNCYFPREWKTAIVCAIPKKPGYCTPSELRPISLTSNVGKLLEMGVIRNMSRELLEDTIPDFQFGFREGHSTLDALQVLNDTLIKQRRKKNVVAVCSLDVKKAFDSVWHCGMVHKLFRQGCEPSTCRMVQSFLANRTARLRIGSIHSGEFTVGRGVPQGSRLGPLLFNIYVGDLRVNTINEGAVLQYADDTLLLHPSILANHAVKVVEEYYSQVERHFENWGIALNASKTNIMIARPQKGRRRGQRYHNITANMGGEVIKPSPSLKYLGVIFDKKGTFVRHAKEASIKGRKLTGACRRLLSKSDLKHKIKVQIYKMLIRSSAMYASPIWLNNKNSNPLKVMERRVFRFILGNWYNTETNKIISNKKLYKGTECDRLSKFHRKVKERHKERLNRHKNSLIRNICNNKNN